ncbi:MAG: hypothetical protein M0T72_11595, partial [Candidatus Dormibacteraeota bacterium]|nr:hypothetical protein [Candidatus Dormibacteraeota bacterium]
MEDRGPESPGEPSPQEERLPEFMNPESEHYQPWADKQIVNASKDKRPLAEFLLEFEQRLREAGPVGEAAWEPDRNQRLLARFDPRPAGPGHKSRRRRRPSGRGPAAIPAAAATTHDVTGTAGPRAGRRPRGCGPRRRARRSPRESTR